MRPSFAFVVLPSLLLALLIGSACGARSELPAPGRAHGAAGAPTDPAEICAKLEAGVEPVQVDLFFMYDTSGSMSEPTTTPGVSKWQALTQAMWGFLFDPAASGLKVGIGFFPRHDFSVPAFCYGAASCPSCTPIGQCVPSNNTMCSTDEQCPEQGDHCQLTGYCSNGDPCDPNVGGCNLGDCTGVGYCADHTRCDIDAYRITGVATLPGDAFGLANAIEAHPLDGFTPTLPAFDGVMQSALDWQAANPDDVVLAVLATDGLPTLCDPALQESGLDAAIASLADVAATGLANGVRSYVLGVFTPDEEASAKARLDTVAEAGGTTSAYVVGTDQNVSAELVKALNEVRLENACSYLLPAGIELLDLSQVRVTAHLEDGSTLDIAQRSGAAACDPKTGGFYFDPAPPAIPQHIVLCQASCALRPSSVTVTCAES